MQANSYHRKTLVWSDIRENGGGDSTVGDEILKYILPKNFQQIDHAMDCYSQLQKDFHHELCKSDDKYCSHYKELSTKSNGAVQSSSTDQLIKRNINGHQFQGHIYLLTSTHTFSSAASFAHAFKHYKIGKIFGEETGGRIVTYGDKMETALPESRLRLTISTKKFYYAGAKENEHRSVLPDVKVPENVALEFTLEEINKNKKIISSTRNPEITV